MQNTFSFSIRLIVSILMLAVLGACGGGGGSSDNDPPPPPTNAPPVLNDIGAQTVAETETLNFSVSATDAESTPTLSVSGLPSGATFNAANGTFNWAPAAGDAANSPYEVIFTATDSGGLTDTENVSITVTVTVPPNQAPVLASIGDQSTAETQALNFTVTATDADSTTPVLSATGLPTDASFDAASGAFAWTPAVGDAANSPYSVTFTATDEVDSTLTATETIEITVTAAPITADCTVGVTSPLAGSLQAAGDPGLQTATATLEVEATFSCTPEIPAGWGVKLAVAGANNGDTDEAIVTSAPFMSTLAGLSKDEYTLTATVVDDTGANVSGAQTEVVVAPVGLGDYYIAIGDSITSGNGDNIENGMPIDGVNEGDLTSADGRTSGGYPALLNDALTTALGYPQLIINEGFAGENSEEGLARLQGVLDQHPGAQRVLVMYGMNDAGTGAARVSNEDFRSNMQAIIEAIVASGKQPILARVNIALADRADVGPEYPDPNAGSRSIAIQGFNTEINGLLTANSISIAAPNFYNLFFDPGLPAGTPQRYESEYSDFIHPDRTGYQSMTNLWRDVLVPSP